MSHRLVRLLATLLSFTVLLGLSGTALAQSGSSTGRIPTDFVRQLSFEGYGGDATLVGADVSIQATLDSRVLTITNSSGTAASFVVTTFARFCGDFTSATITDYVSCEAAASPTSLRFQADVLEETFEDLGPGETGSSTVSAMAQDVASVRLLDAESLETLRSQEQIEYTVATLAGFEALGGGGNSLVEIETFADASIAVSYIFADVAIEKLTNGVDGPTISTGQEVIWTYDVTNVGNTALQNVVVVDDREGEVCVLDLLDAGVTEQCSLTGVAGSDDYTNNATVTGEPVINPTLSVDDTDDSGYTVPPPTPVPTATPIPTATPVPTATPTPEPTSPPGVSDSRPAIDIELATNGVDADDPPGVSLQPGQAVTWTYVVTNTGVVDLYDVVVTDDATGGVCDVGFLPVFGRAECTRLGTAAQQGVEALTATVVGISLDGLLASDTDPTHHTVDDEVLGRVELPDPDGDPNVPPADPGATTSGGAPPDEVLAYSGFELGAGGILALTFLCAGAAVAGSGRVMRRRKLAEE